MDIDTLDRQIVHALRVDGRAGYREIGAVLGVSDQTVARRYRRLREGAGVRVVGMPNPIRLGYESWMLRLHTSPDMAGPLADALARRPDTAWVSVFSGGTEISCLARLAAHADRESLLLEKLPRTPRLVSVTAHCLIHHFVGGAVGPDRRDAALTPDQIAALTPDGVPSPPPPPFTIGASAQPADPADTSPIRLADGDEALLEVLSRDGRAGYAELAAATGWPESTVRRRMRDLRRSGALYYDVEVRPQTFGFLAPVLLWVTVAPSRLAAVGAALAEHEEVVFAAATTGSTNLVATVICTDMAAFYRYLTERISGLDGVDKVESAPLLRHVKQLGRV
ncbi:Lrp/AsnC family transcriptional regulator [Actinoplanes sp. NPDC026670]|uniref:Lrp/AsnC family transcriptional regulator n=1 Tax=Actinoplanes sp. NPDC026670 TaxID=3154700 RepID=UPI0033D65825